MLINCKHSSRMYAGGKFMPKKEKKVPTLKEALEAFDLKAYKEWMKNCAPLLWNTFKSYDKRKQMAQMCWTICKRTDMLATRAHLDAVVWLNEHNMCGGLW